LKGINLQAWRPKWMLVESWNVAPDYHQYLVDNGYACVGRISWDNIYERVREC
jgi:hypothetical protein